MYKAVNVFLKSNSNSLSIEQTTTKMKTSYFTFTAFCAAAAIAAPDAPTRTWRGPNGRTIVSYIAKFDDANAGILPGAPIRGITPLGPYDSLYYSNMVGIKVVLPFRPT